MERKAIKISKTPEAKIFAAGAVLLFISAVIVSLLYLWNEKLAQQVLLVAVLHCLFGRAAGMYLGLLMELNLFFIIYINVIIDTLWVLINYPIVMLGVRKLFTFAFLQKYVERVLNVANRYQKKINQYGKLGLYLFVMCPLPMTGPIVGAVIGNILNFRPKIILVLVLLGCYSTIALWAIILPLVHIKALEYGSRASLFLMFGLIITVLLFKVLSKVFNHDFKINGNDQ